MKFLINTTIALAIISILALVFSSNGTILNYLITLPLSILILSVFFRHRIRLYKYSVVIYLIFFQIIIRYLILPVFIESGDSMISGYNDFFGSETVFIMILEAVTIFMFLAFNVKNNQKRFIERNEINFFIRPKISLILLLMIIFIYISLSGYLNKVNYIWQLQSFIENKSDLEEVSSLSSILFYPFRIILSLMMFSYIYLSRLGDKAKVFWIVVLLALNSIIIVGTSRFSILLTSLPLFFIAYVAFYKIRNYLSIGFVSLLIPVILITSIGKFGNENNLDNKIEFFNGNSLNAYFSGPGNVNSALELYYSKENWPSVQYFFNDWSQNVPILSHYTNDAYKTNIIFNEKIYGHTIYQDQIVPLSLNGLLHFGVIGLIIYPLFFIFLAFQFEGLYFKERYIGYKLVYLTLAITLSLFFMLNIGSLIATVFRNIVFLLFPLFLLRKTDLFFKSNK